MDNYGISTDNIPLFLGNECIIQHIKSLRIRNRDIQRDSTLIVGSLDTRRKSNSDFNLKGWLDISNSLLNLDELFAFVGVQTLKTRSGEHPVALKLIKFRHKDGKTQARVAVEQHPFLNSIQNLINVDNYTEIFIYQKVGSLNPNSGYGVHIYDSDGRLKYKDGLSLLNNIKRYSISSQNNEPLSIGRNKAILQTANIIKTRCYKNVNHWNYVGSVWTSYLDDNGKACIVACEEFINASAKRHEYPSFAKGGEYEDVILSTDHILVIDKPI